MMYSRHKNIRIFLCLWLQPNQKFSWEHSGRLQCLQSTHYRGNYGWHMSRLLRETSHNAAHNI